MASATTSASASTASASTSNQDNETPACSQDHLTKFSHLRPLKKKCMKEVAWELYLIFCRAPVITQSVNGKKFRNSLVKSLQLLWPGLQIVHGRPRAPQTQGTCEFDWQGIKFD